MNEGDIGYKVNTAESTVTVKILPVNDRPISTVRTPSGYEDMVQVVIFHGINDRYGEAEDVVSVTIEAVQLIFSNDYNEQPQLFYQYDENWYNSYVIDPTSVTVNSLTPLNIGELVTDPSNRVLFVPPQNMNNAASRTETPLFLAPQIQYQIVETYSHAAPYGLTSVISDWVGIVANPVNDAPVTWGGLWNVESNDAYDKFYQFFLWFMIIVLIL